MVKSYSQLSNYILAELEQVKNHALEDYNNYDFASSLQEILNFLVQDVSAFYASISKDSLYCDEANSQRRKEYQSVFYQVVTTLNILLAPVLAFTMDEVYQNIPGHKCSHVALEDMVKESHQYDVKVLEEYHQFMILRDEVMRKLEEARTNQVIGSGLEASVNLVLDEEKEKLLAKFNCEELKDIFIVSEVNLTKGNEFSVEVKRHTGEKCERCWSYHHTLLEVNGSKVCPRCKKVLENGKFF